jgi:predicted RNase H-like nuclease (RuvC/YqgF family)
MATSDVQTALETIRQYEEDIRWTKSELKTCKERIKEELESTHEYSEVQRLSEELAQAKEKLRISLGINGGYNDLLETKADLSEELRDQQEILSDHIVYYFKATDEKQLEIRPGAGIDIIVTGKLGKKEEPFQTSLLASVSK